MKFDVSNQSDSVDITKQDSARSVSMRRELFGVFGDRQTFEQLRPESDFPHVFATDKLTIGMRDPDLSTNGWSSTHQADDGTCVIFGECYPPDDVESEAARWLYHRYHDHGTEAFASLNGSYLAVLSTPEQALVATDPVRSRECFYTDAAETRVFGTDAGTVAPVIRRPTINRDAILEYLHIGVTLGEKTSVQELRRLPMDSILRDDAVEELDRFVYNTSQFAFAEELAERLRRAIERRARLPGSKGLLLSAGYDSRALLAQIPEIDCCYTVGNRDAQEVVGARRLARQYETEHVTFVPDRRYLHADDRKARYAQGIKESIHIHHAGYDDAIDADTMYHGLLCDTFLRGHFTAMDHLEAFGVTVPFGRPDPDPDPVSTLLSKFGYDRDASIALASNTGLAENPETFVWTAVANEFEAATNRADSRQNAINACGIGNQPSMPFHTQIADNYLGSFLPLDIELIEWHLATPPGERTTATFLDACRELDPSMIEHRPPDRPHHSYIINEVERFVRHRTPFVRSFDSPWPDRDDMYDRYDLDDHLLSEFEHLHEVLPARHKLRIHDLASWMRQAAPDAVSELERLLAHPDH